MALQVPTCMPGSWSWYIICWYFAVDKSKRPFSKLVSEKTKNFSIRLTINFEISPLSCRWDPPYYVKRAYLKFKVSWTEKLLVFSDTNFETGPFDLSTTICRCYFLFIPPQFREIDRYLRWVFQCIRIWNPPGLCFSKLKGAYVL